MSKGDDSGRDLGEVVEGLSAWLDNPQDHLNTLSRRKVLELMLIGFAEKVRAKEARKAWGQSVMLWGSMTALALTLGPKLLDVVKLALGVPQ